MAEMSRALLEVQEARLSYHNFALFLLIIYVLQEQEMELYSNGQAQQALL